MYSTHTNTQKIEMKRRLVFRLWLWKSLSCYLYLNILVSSSKIVNNLKPHAPTAYNAKYKIISFYIILWRYLVYIKPKTHHRVTLLLSVYVCGHIKHNPRNTVYKRNATTRKTLLRFVRPGFCLWLRIFLLNLSSLMRVLRCTV